jgi:hypothetical protein
MSDQEDFLARWSRRKREVAEEKSPSEKPAVEQAEKPASQGAGEQQAVAARLPGVKAPPEPEFDVSKLPSIESIGAETDIRAFLQAGVPSPLRLAALRRAWVMDPAIRDYIGPAENAWDFTDPNAMPGFGALDEGTDVKKLVAEIFGDIKPPAEASAAPEKAASPAQAPAQLSDSSDTGSSADVSNASESATDGMQQVAAASDEKDLLQREENIASQYDDDTSESSSARVRRHGSAMPH